MSRAAMNERLVAPCSTNTFGSNEWAYRLPYPNAKRDMSSFQLPYV